SSRLLTRLTISLLDSQAGSFSVIKKREAPPPLRAAAPSLEASGRARAHRRSLGGRLLAEIQVEHVVEGAGEEEADDESDVSEVRVVGRYGTDIDAKDVGEQIHGAHQPDRHGDDALPAVVGGVVEHALVAVIAAAQPVVDEHDGEPGSDPV